MTKLSRSRAFSLIELLVLIAVMTVLAALLFPVFAHARDKTREANCLSSLKQLSLALMMYVQDCDDTLPRIRSVFRDSDACVAGGQSRTWKGAVQSYVKSYEFWKCPSNPQKDLPTEDVDKQIHQSYAVNGVIFHAGGDPTEVPPRRYASFADPAATMALLESIAACPDLGDWVGNADESSGEGGWCGIDGRGWHSAPYQVKFQQHSGMLNWGFLDGHASAMKYAQLWIPGLTVPYHDLWGTWEDEGDGRPDQSQLRNGARAKANIKNMCLYLR